MWIEEWSDADDVAWMDLGLKGNDAHRAAQLCRGGWTPDAWKLLTISKRSSGLASNAVFVNSATSFAVHVTPSVRSWIELGESGLDTLVSNADILTPGPLEVLPLDEIRHEFEVNVFGALTVINAILPALRKSRGRIVQIGSTTGRFPVPFNGPSRATKAAFEAFADVYRAELKPFGVAFVMVQPGNMRTGGPAKTAAALKRIAEVMTDDQRALYGDAFGKFSDSLNNMQFAGLSAEASADRVIEQIPPPIRVAVRAAEAVGIDRVNALSRRCPNAAACTDASSRCPCGHPGQPPR
jgi:NAD(P)-dependent dehydrogenase (short-subunit alcohol dehydrogenase family)